MPFSSDITEDILNETFDNEQSNKLDILYEKLKETNDIDIQLQIYAIENQEDDEAPPEWSCLNASEQKVWIKKAVDAGLFEPEHGDPFQWLEEGYRNENLWFWHGTKGPIGPCTEIDDYGSVPKCFLVGNNLDTEFDPYYWDGLVDHNSIVFLSPEIMEEIKNNLKLTSELHGHWKGTVMIRGFEYTVVVSIKDITKLQNAFHFDGKERIFYNV
jgi:hypothetical protein